jgi:prepilin-type N-terminal cleavage/methylation domain-containing protein/prepilin-type processing-associated H-X9-DG protein
MKPETSLCSRRTAFTLIELLVVIGIISILAAILFPVFARVRENARRASCQSNLKQIALGIMQYSQDYDEYFPLVAYNLSGAPIGGWVFTTQPYLKSTQIFQCPSQPNRDNTAPDINSESWGASDYFYNSNLGVMDTSTNCPNQKFIVKEAEVDSPASVIMLGDGGRGGAHNIANCPPVGTTPGALDPVRRPRSCDVPGWLTRSYTNINAWATQTEYDAIKITHLDGMNVGFVDGHVKWYKAEKLTFDNPSTGVPSFKANDINAGLSAAKPGCTS